MTPILGVFVVATALSSAADKAPNKASARTIEAQAAALKADQEVRLAEAEAARRAFDEHQNKMSFAGIDATIANTQALLRDLDAKRDAQAQADKAEMARLKKENADLKERLKKAEAKPTEPKPAPAKP